jgi:O-antigen ligase
LPTFTNQGSSITALNNGLNWNSLWLAAFLVISLGCGAAIPIFGGMWSFGALIALAVTVATLMNYAVGVWFLVLLLPLSGTTFFPHQLFGIAGANPHNLLLAMTLLSVAIPAIWHGRYHGIYAYPRLWWGYVAPLALGVGIGSDHVDEIPGYIFRLDLVKFDNIAGYLRDCFVKPLTYLLIAILMGSAIRDGMKFRALVIAICVSLFLVAGLIFFYIVSQGYGLEILSSAHYRHALTETWINANDVGALGAFVLTLMLFMLAHDTDRHMRWLLLLTAIVAGGLLFVSFSRGAFVAFFVGLCAFLIRQRRFSVIMVIVLILAVLVPLLPGELYERLGTGFDTGGQNITSKNDQLTAGRVAGVWLPLLPEVRKNPVLGNGIESMMWSGPFRNGAIIPNTTNPHNSYLKAALDVGFVGLGLFLLFFVDLRRRFLDVARDPKTPPLEAGLFQGGAAAILGYAVFAFTGGDYLPRTSNVYIWMLLGLLLGRKTGLAPVNRLAG